MSDDKQKKGAMALIDKNSIHADELRSTEHGGLWPFKVDLAVQVEPGTEPIVYTMFLRAPELNDAMWTAVAAFNYYEHELPCVIGEYPRICGRESELKSIAIGLSEEQYDEFWKEAQKAKECVFAGMRENPSWFRFVNDKEIREMNNLKSTVAKSVIVPSLGSFNDSLVKKNKSILDEGKKRKS